MLLTRSCLLFALVLLNILIVAVARSLTLPINEERKKSENSYSHSRPLRQVVQPKWLTDPDAPSLFQDSKVHVTKESLDEAAAIRAAIQKAVNEGQFAVEGETGGPEEALPPETPSPPELNPTEQFFQLWQQQFAKFADFSLFSDMSNWQSILGQSSETPPLQDQEAAEKFFQLWQQQFENVQFPNDASDWEKAFQFADGDEEKFLENMERIWTKFIEIPQKIFDKLS